MCMPSNLCLTLNPSWFYSYIIYSDKQISQACIKQGIACRLSTDALVHLIWRERLWCWWVATAPPCAHFSQSSIAPSTGVAMETPAFPLTPCEQSHGISPEKRTQMSTQLQALPRKPESEERSGVSVFLHSRVTVQVCHRVINLCVHDSLMDKLDLCRDDYVKAWIN